MVDPGAGPSAVPGGRGELRGALRGEGQHRQPDARPAAADLRQAGPHCPGRDDALDAEAVPGLDGGHGAQQFEGRGHSLTIDSGWREVADATLAWLEAMTGQSVPVKATAI